MNGADDKDEVSAVGGEGPYRYVESPALWCKGILQMLTGVGMVIAVGIYAATHWRRLGHEHIHALQQGIFDVVGVGLALAAAIELAFTLFTDGPDEALDPGLLAVAAALIIQLGADINGFSWQDGATTCLFVLAIAGLFATRKYLAELRRPSPAKRR